MTNSREETPFPTGEEADATPSSRRPLGRLEPAAPPEPAAPFQKARIERRRLVIRVGIRVVIMALLALWFWSAADRSTLAIPVLGLLLYAVAVLAGGRSRDLQDTLVALGDVPGLLAIVWLTPQEFALDGIVAVWLISTTFTNQRRFRLPLLLLTAAFAWGAVAVQAWLALHSWQYLLGQSLLIAVATVIGYVMLLERRRGWVDPLTGVLARGPGLQELQEQLAGGRACRVAFVDLRGFKAINDAYGHQVGDEVLRIAGARLLGAVRTRDLVIRYGGDEFLVSSCADDLKNRLAEAMERPAHVAGHVIPVRARIGVLRVEEGMGFEFVVEEADRRMYRDSARSRGAAPGA